jgi:Mce-associated membrane protein
MDSPSKRPTRRRIAGERTRPSGSTPPAPAPQETVAPEQTSGPAVASEDTAAPVEAATTATDAGEPDRSAPTPRPDRGGPPTWVLAVLAGLLVAALALDGFVVWREVNQHRAQEEAARAMHSAVIQAPAVAERSAEALLSFQHDTVQQDVAEARRLLSDRYAPDYISSIEASEGVAAQTKATVSAEVLSSGVVEASGERADILLFVNQTTKAPGQESRTALNRVVFTMVPRESGWLVDEIKAF